MKINIPATTSAPSTSLYVKVIKKNARDLWDRDVIIMIPGGPGGNHTLYEDIEDALFEYADIVIIDLRGCGYSNSSNVKYCTLEQNIKDLEFVRRSLGINKPIIHGCSYGAIVALGYCIKYPKSLMKLVLSSGAASGDFIRSAQSNLMRRGTSEQIEFGNILWNGKFKNSDHFSEYYRVMSTLYFYNKSSQEKLPTNKTAIPYNIELVNFAFNSFLLKFDYQDVEGALVVAGILIFID